MDDIWLYLIGNSIRCVLIKFPVLLNIKEESDWINLKSEPTEPNCYLILNMANLAGSSLEDIKSSIGQPRTH